MTDYISCDRCGSSVEVPQLAAEQADELRCDMCGRVVEDYVNDLFHYSGRINGADSGHIHLCGECDAMISPPKFDFDKLSTYPTHAHP